MVRLARCAKWVAAIGALLLALLIGAVIVCFGAPLAFGIGSDIVVARPGPVALALEAGAAILLWRLSRRRLPYAAKSIT
jgi:hypothetical protein